MSAYINIKKKKKHKSITEKKKKKKTHETKALLHL